MRPPYSYRPDSSVARFADDRPIIIFDDAVYMRVARNRLRWFGKRETCYRPDPKFAGRFLS